MPRNVLSVNGLSALVHEDVKADVMQREHRMALIKRIVSVWPTLTMCKAGKGKEILSKLALASYGKLDEHLYQRSASLNSSDTNALVASRLASKTAKQSARRWTVQVLKETYESVEKLSAPAKKTTSRATKTTSPTKAKTNNPPSHPTVSGVASLQPGSPPPQNRLSTRQKQTEAGKPDLDIPHAYVLSLIESLVSDKPSTVNAVIPLDRPAPSAVANMETSMFRAKLPLGGFFGIPPFCDITVANIKEDARPWLQIADDGNYRLMRKVRDGQITIDRLQGAGARCIIYGVTIATPTTGSRLHVFHRDIDSSFTLAYGLRFAIQAIESPYELYIGSERRLVIEAGTAYDASALTIHAGSNLKQCFRVVCLYSTMDLTQDEIDVVRNEAKTLELPSRRLPIPIYPVYKA